MGAFQTIAKLERVIKQEAAQGKSSHLTAYMTAHKKLMAEINTNPNLAEVNKTAAKIERDLWEW